MKPDHADEVIEQWRSEMPEIVGVALEVAKRTARLGALLDAATAGELNQLGLTRAEYEILATLRRIGAPYRLRPTELTSALPLTSGGTSNVLRRLVEAGLVTREANPADGRSSWVQLTPEGVALAEAAVRHSVAAQSALIDRVPAGDARALADQLRDVLVALGDASRRPASIVRLG